MQLSEPSEQQIDAYNTLVAEIKAKPPHEQVAVWAEALETMVLNRASPMADRLRELDRTRYDVQSALVAIGPDAVPALIDLIERYSHLPARRSLRPDEETEFSKTFFKRLATKDPEWSKVPTVPTPEGDLVSAAKRVVFEIGPLS